MKVVIDGVEYTPHSVGGMSLRPLNAREPDRIREETEASLINLAQLSISKTNWEVGECAMIWMKRFSRGRTDSDFAAVVGLNVDQVYQRRRVWEAFADVFLNYPNLRWSHFFAAMDWDDSHACLKWADDVQAGVAEMKAWRRAQRGEDLAVINEQGTLFE